MNKDKSVVAWFTKELPYYLGPKFFYGLPGLILEINEGNTIVLKATEIKTYNKKIKIPEFEKLLSARQADSILALANKKAEALLDN